MRKEKQLFMIVLIGWIMIALTIFHDIIFALKYDMKVPQVKAETGVRMRWGRNIGLKELLEKLFPFCCLYRHQPTEWVSLRERVKIWIGASVGWFIVFTLPWILVRKGIMYYEKDDY